MAALILIGIYGLLIAAGGVLWLIGACIGNKKPAQRGEMLVLIGMGIDALLLVTNWMFSWTDWLR